VKGMRNMGRKNYVKYSKMNKEENNEVVLDKTSFEEVIKTQNNEIENETQNEEPKQPDPIPAIVVGCTKLRVRKKPNVDADVFGTISEGTELTVDNGDQCYGDFYKVYTVINDTLIEGYCMKKFIKLK